MLHLRARQGPTSCQSSFPWENGETPISEIVSNRSGPRCPPAAVPADFPAWEQLPGVAVLPRASSVPECSHHGEVEMGHGPTHPPKAHTVPVLLGVRWICPFCAFIASAPEVILHMGLKKNNKIAECISLPISFGAELQRRIACG